MLKEKYMKDKGKNKLLLFYYFSAVVKLKISSTIENPRHSVFCK